MGVLANHVPSIEQLKPGLVEIIEESGGSKQFFRMHSPTLRDWRPERPKDTKDNAFGFQS
jgi:hypothetical protein